MRTLADFYISDPQKTEKYHFGICHPEKADEGAASPISFYRQSAEKR